jgi:hypothetical protein
MLFKKSTAGISLSLILKHNRCILSFFLKSRKSNFILSVQCAYTGCKKKFIGLVQIIKYLTGLFVQLFIFGTF